ncbi:MAG: hypothetical protein ACRC35_10605 [Angustibacter sp.]
MYSPPTSLPHALEFVEAIVGAPHCVRLRPGPRHFEIFLDLCRQVEARGNVVPDAYQAALAIETGSTWGHG